MVVFDLDGTLYDNRPRSLQILFEYGEEVRDEYPDVAEALTKLDTDRIRYLLSDTLRDCGLSQVDVVRDITHYWRERFFTDEYCSYDVPTEGAADYVRACYDAGGNIVYLTGRDVPGMLIGTVSSLRDDGFPLGIAGVELVLKPDATLPDEAFKRSALPTLERLGRIVGFFDNEPANCNTARTLFPEAEVALIDSQKVPGAPDLVADIELVSDFRV